MQFRTKSILSIAVAATLSIAGLAPAHASIPAEQIGNNICDFSALNQGRGSASDPYLIESAIDLREMSDCQNRYKNIYSGIVNEDGTATFSVESVHGTFGVGQNIYIRYTEGAFLDADNATVVSATDDTITVRTSAAPGTTTGGGQIQAYYAHFKLNADINLGAASTESWNNTTEIDITAAVKNSDSDSFTFTGANTLQGGETLYIDGMGDKRFNQGYVSVISATPENFTTTLSFAVSAGEATAAGGKAHFPGWSPISPERFELDGAGHTISGMKIYRHDSFLGLFGQLKYATIRNLKMKDAVVNGTSNTVNDSRDHMGVLAGYLERSITDNITIESSTVLAGGNYGGLLAGHIWGSSITNSTLSGSVKPNVLALYGDQGVWWSQFGGVTGLGENTSVVNANVGVTVNGSTLSQNAEQDAVESPTMTNYVNQVGGLIGRSANEMYFENITSTGDVTGSTYVGGAFGEMGNNGSSKNVSVSGNVVSTVAAQQGGDIYFVGGFAGKLAGQSDNVNLIATGSVTVTAPAERQAAIRYVGGFAGDVYSQTTNKAIKSSGTVTVEQLGNNDVAFVGGLFGHTDRDALTDSVSNSNVNVHSVSNNVANVGGVIGYLECCTIQARNTSTSNVVVTLDNTSAVAYDIGGYAGVIGLATSFDNIALTGSVTVAGGRRVGGFAGRAEGDSKFANISIKGNVTSSYLGGENWDNAANVGGFIGWLPGRVMLDKVSVVGNVTATTLTEESSANFVGGFFGTIPTGTAVVELRNALYRGTVSGSNSVGGLIGYASNEMTYRVENSLVVAQVIASAPNGKRDNVMNSYFRDSTKTNFMDSTVAGSPYNGAGFNAANSADLKIPATFSAKGWTFSGSSPWRISETENNGYPYLVAPVMDGSKVTPPVVTPPTIAYTALKSIAFTKKVTALTTAQKKVLVALAKTIAKRAYTVYVVDATPTIATYALTAQRAANVQAFLTAELKKLKSKAVVGISVVAKTTGGSATIKVNGGK